MTASNQAATEAAQSVVHSGRSKRFGPWVTVGTVAIVLAAACVTLFGLGAFDRAVAVYDPVAWLFSKNRGEVGRVNGDTAKVDTRVKVNGSAGHNIEISQSDRYLIVRDRDTGVVSALDLTNLQIAASMNTTAGEGVRVVVHGSTAYVIDRVHGVVRQLDPLTLNPVGAPIDFAPGLSGGDFDVDGRLWFALPSQGTVVSLNPARKAGEAPKVDTRSVTEPSHDLSVSVLDRGVAVLDQTADQLITLVGSQLTRTPLSLANPGNVPPRTSGAEVPVTVPASREVVVVDRGAKPEPKVSSFPVPGVGASLSPAVAWAGWFYVADNAAGVVYVLNSSGQLADQIRFTGQSDGLELQVRDKYLYINATGAATARVVDSNHKVSVVDKYPNNVPGGDPPPVPPPPTNPPPPPVGPPGAPSSVVATGGNTTVHLSWSRASDNGSPITKYVVSGAGKTVQVGANQRSLDITGLTNGTTYTFSVYAANAKGNGPPRNSNPVVPTSDTPDPPAGVTAQENKDGTVTVSWQAANGQGHKVASYQINAVGPNSQQLAGQAAGTATSFTVPTGTLTYGTQYAFSVTTINDKGASSKPSALSASVVPYTVPDAPASLAVTTGTAKGSVHVVWAAPASNGRPITGYTLSYNGTSTTVTGTSTDLANLPDGQSVSVSVVANNAAGSSKAAGPKQAKTIAVPTVTLTGSSVGYNSITANFTVNDGGGTATCNLAINGAGNANGNCNNITVSGLAPGVAYGFTVKVTNVAGSATATGNATTTAVWGTVRCVNPSGSTYCNSGIGIYSQPWQDTSSQTSPSAKNGERLQGFCKITGKKGNQQPEPTLRAVQYNNNKTSDQWIKISNTQARYIPWIWLNLDNGDNLSVLPNC